MARYRFTSTQTLVYPHLGIVAEPSSVFELPSALDGNWELVDAEDQASDEENKPQVLSEDETSTSEEASDSASPEASADSDSEGQSSSNSSNPSPQNRSRKVRNTNPASEDGQEKVEG